jgi:hypothetical protein
MDHDKKRAVDSEFKNQQQKARVSISYVYATVVYSASGYQFGSSSLLISRMGGQWRKAPR